MPKGRRLSSKEQKLHDERLARLPAVADLYLKRGYKHRQIAACLGITENKARSDIAMLRHRWEKEATRHSAEWLAQELARIDAIEQEAWAAWERSQKTALSDTVEESETLDRDGVKITLTRRSKNKKKQYGDPKFLQIALSAHERRAKILKLDDPYYTDSADDTPVMEVVVENPEQVAMIIRYGQIKKLPERSEDGEVPAAAD